ncbi:MAG TPA: Ig-like domain-containing protein [Kiritimatiellia bacterium]|nr:Ig-like domain-containing protein [Kiritimatiellia bacterium]
MKTWTPRLPASAVRRLTAAALFAATLAPGLVVAQPEVNLTFSSPATNSAPGATFSGGFNFGPFGATLDSFIVAGTSIVPQTNITITGGGTNRTVSLEPLPNQSGSVTARIEAVSGGSTGSVQFVVVFRPYPPVISAVANRTIPEDGSTNVPFTVSDPDTPVTQLVVTATSSNTNLVDAVLGGSGSNRTVQLTPRANINGSSTITITVEDGLHTTNRIFTLTVTPVPDPSTISGLVNRAFGDNVGVTNVFASVSIADVDHLMPSNELLVATAVLANDQFATLANGQLTQIFTGTPAQVTTAIAGVGVQPLPFRGIPGTINNLSSSVRVRGVADNISVTSTVTLAIEVINTPPSFAMTLNPTSVVEGLQVQPFQVGFIYDPDLGEDEFSLSIQLVNTNQASLLNIIPTTALTNNIAGLIADVQNLVVQATPAALTSLTEQVAFRFILNDGFGGVATETNIFTIVQSQSPPQISGIPVQTVNRTDADPAFTVFPTVFVQDQNQGGLQPVQAVLTQTDPSLGTFSATGFPFQTPAQLSLALQSVTYTPTPGALPVDAIGESTFTLVATDSSGLKASNSSVKVRITSVNLAPQFVNLPPPEDQPLLLAPAAPLLPFAELGLWNDDSNSVLVTLSIDNVSKGSLTNLGSFSQTGPGQYQMSGSLAAVLGSLTNIAYTLNPLFPFPPDDPGGTVFTLSARDYALLTTTKTLYIQVQEAPRNHLVTRTANDGLPGSFTYALANAGNNDVITFALPSYPAIVRMPGSSPSTLQRNVTIKGPGANLLAISGDGNGDTTPDRQLFRIRSRVTIEGVTLTHGTAAFGGAILVESNGFLTLRRCAVVDSSATQYGGAIDVDGGQLTLDGCFIARNRVSEDLGVSAGGVSIYSDKEIQIINTTFAGNVQPNATGDGGGALVAQRRSNGVFMNTYVKHCTFIDNEDASTRASAALSVDFGTRIRAANSIFSDFSGRNIDVAGAGVFISLGGNICDDSTRTLNLQEGQSGDVFLLDHITDDTLTDPLLAPLNLSGDPTPFAEPLAGSPAINKGFGSTTAVDQRGVLRQGLPDAGAAEFNALGRLVINEILFEDGPVHFVELYVRRDSTPVDLAPYSLFIDGVKVHDFAASTIIGTNALFAANDPAPTLVNPGFGFVVAFTNNPISVTSDSNPTPVVRPSETNAPNSLPSRGIITVGAGGAMEPVARAAYLGDYLDPASGTNLLDTTGNSIALAPQYRGFALVPHSLILPGPFDGVDMSRNMAVNQYSIGADVLGTPFGQENAEPLAVPDVFTVSEDDLSTLLVLANDFDGDGNDRLVIVDVSATSDAGSGDAAVTNSQLGAELAISPDDLPLRGTHIVYDPRATAALQALPVGVEIIDTFYYEIIDYGSAAVEGYSDGTGGTTIVAATNHRLTNDAEIVITGAFPADYNGVHAVTVVDENEFTIAVPYVAATSNGTWETVLPRAPTSRDEASVSVRVVGANDPPVANLDVITNVTERQTVRLMVRPELAGTPLVFPGDPVPAPDMLAQDILSNDDDIDSDDTWSTLRAYAVLGSVNEIVGYTGTPGAQPVIVEAPAHGLLTGDQLLIANYGGHPSYNGFHTVTVLNDNFLSIPVFYVDNAAEKGVWAVVTEANRYSATTDVGATVTLTLRANQEEDHLIYDASASAFLQGLAEGELYTNRFYYAVADSHGAIGIGPIDFVIVGVNNTPTPGNDPGALDQLDPLVGGTNTLSQVLKFGLDLMYTLPPTAGGSNRVDLQVLDLGGTIPGTIVLNDFFTTTEDKVLQIQAADLLANDTDIDRIDVLNVIAVDALSREGALVSLGGTTITFNPTTASNLQALAREELLVDTFNAVISDGMTGGTVTSLVAVLVVGVNDTPIANPDFRITNEDEVLVIDPRTNDVERDINFVIPDDRLRIVAVTNWPNPGLALVNMSGTNVTHDAPVSQLLNQLADWQSFTNVFGYAITDNSFLFAMDDEFYVPAGTVGRVLDVLANDRDFTDSAGNLTIISAGPTLQGGVVSISTNGQSLVYSSPAAFAGDDYFRYTIQNDKGDVNSGRVLVRSVVASINGVLHAANDHYAVAAGETAVMNVLSNDGMLPANGGALAISGIISSSIPGQPILTNNTFVYVATNGAPTLTFRYEVNGGGSSTAQADVTLAVIERRGTLNIRDDAFSVLAGSFDNELDVLANDALVTASTAGLFIKEIVQPPLNGTLTTNGAGTRLVYTPNVEFIGIEQVAYLAADGIGGTGTGLVSIAVGRVDVAPDFFKIAATTNPVPVGLNVLANDRMLANPTGTLTIVSVNPSAPTAIGTLQIHGSGKSLLFTPSNTLGQLDFDYVVEDGGTPARVATGRVTIATVASGIYANPDRFIVRGGGADYVFNVLTNDISYPNVNKTYTILSIGVGPNAPNQGGVVSIVDNRLVYTPANGFFGEETFTYLMSDSVNTDVAQVSVSVRRGDLIANDDAYTVYYELLPGTNVAASFTLPVTLNDRIQPPLDQVISIFALGAGTNQPSQGGSLQVAPDNQSLIYRPVLATATSYVEQFTYEISDGGDRRASAVVRVLVQNRASNLVAVTQDDAFTVARNSTNNVLPVLANDFVLPGSAAGWKVTGVGASLYGATVSFSNTVVRYTPPAGFVGVDVFSYSVSDGLGGTGEALVTVRVGSMPTMPDLFVALSGTSNNELDVLANDPLTTDYEEEYTLHSVFGQNAGGAVSVSGGNTVLYTPVGVYTGGYPYTESFFYRVADESSVLVTGRVQVLVQNASSGRSTSTITLVVEGRNDQPEIDNPAMPIAITDKESTKPFLHVLFTEVDQQLQEVVDVTVALDDAAKGTFRNQDGFVEVLPGVYALTNVTAAHATVRIRDIIFEPTENRITVPQSETTFFTITITDNKSAPVTDTNSTVTVTAINDPPQILGTRADQTTFRLMPIHLFSSVTIVEVDDLTLQPLTVTITMDITTNGVLTNTSSFALLTAGVYRATGITAAAATAQLRLMQFVPSTNPFPIGTSRTNAFLLEVNDGFAPTVSDFTTTVIALNSYEGQLQPTNINLRGQFGTSVDTLNDFAVVGAPGATTNGINAGSAFIYRRDPTPAVTNNWIEWRHLRPAQVDTNDRFGQSVAISPDLIAVGADGDETGGIDMGAVYLFGRHVGGSNNWGELVRIAPTNVANAARFGYAVQVEGDWLAVGAPRAALDGTTNGAVFIFNRNAGGPDAWGEVARRTPTGAGITNSDFGWNLALSGDRLAVGAPRADINTNLTLREGSAYFLSRNTGGPDNWGIAQRVDSLVTNQAGEFGWSVAVDGNLALIGAPAVAFGTNTSVGVAYLLEWNATSNAWVHVTRFDRQTENERRFGNAVGIKGKRLIIGAPFTATTPNLGATFMLRPDPASPTNWIQVFKFNRPAGSTAGQFGASLGIDTETFIVGAPADTAEGSNRGFAYIFRYKPNNPPVLALPVADQFADLGDPYHFPIPAGTFTDPDLDDVLTLTATFPSGSNGLDFISGAVTGTSEYIGMTPVALQATDLSGASASQTFQVIVIDGILLSNTPRDLWNLARFGNDVTNAALAASLWGGGANPDGDDLSNDEEYAFGGDPNAPEDRRITLGPSPDGHLIITYHRRTDDPGLLYTLQGSNNMTTWMDMAWTVISETTAPVEPGVEFVTVKIAVIGPVTVQHYRILVGF